VSTLRQAAARPQVGTCIGDRYRLDSLIAIGGMGEVWRAHDTVLDRDVALKALRDEKSGPDELARFEREARHAAAVAHPGLATVYDFVSDEGQAYLVVELVDGEPLSAVIARDAPLPADATIGILAATADALTAVHAAGVVHRDVKPGNILLTPDGRVKLTDFGIARHAEDEDADDIADPDGMVMGTEAYMSPEHRRGKATLASDLYALGVVGFELLTGHRPAAGEQLPDTVPAGLQHALNAAMAAEPADRPATADAFASTLRAIDPYDVPTNVMTPAPVPLGEPTMRYTAAVEPDLALASRRWRRATTWMIASIAVVLLLVAIIASATANGDPLVPEIMSSTTVTPTSTTQVTAPTQPAQENTPQPKGKKKKGKGNGGD